MQDERKQQQADILQELGASIHESAALDTILQDAYRGSYDPILMEQHFNRSIHSLCDPLGHKEADADSKRFVESNRSNFKVAGITRPFNLTDFDLNLINEFAKSTNLNQKYIAKLVYDGKLRIQMARRGQEQMRHSMSSQDLSNLQNYVKDQFFNARILRLKVLREIIVLYDMVMPKGHGSGMLDDDVAAQWAPEIQKIVGSVVERLFQNNIIPTLCRSIRHTMAIVGRSAFADEFQQEMCEIVNIIYSISPRIECNADDIQHILKCFKEMTLHKEFPNLQRVKASSYLLWISLYSSLDPSGHSLYIDPRSQHKLEKNHTLSASNDTSVRQMLITSVNETRNKAHDDHLDRAQQRSASFLLLVITLVFKIDANVQKKTCERENCAKALLYGAIDGLYKDLLLSSAMLEDFKSIKQSIFTSLADILLELLEVGDPECRNYFAREKKYESDALNRRGGARRAPREGRHALSNTLCTMIHLARSNSPFSSMFVSNDSGKAFLRYLDEESDFNNKWFHLYAVLLYELAMHSSPAVVHDLIKEHCHKISIEMIWEMLHKSSTLYLPRKVVRANPSYLATNQNPAGNVPASSPYGYLATSGVIADHDMEWITPPEMTLQEEQLVSSMLMVLEAMGQIDTVRIQIDFQHRPPGIIALLFSLLQCQLPTEVRARVILCIASFAKGSPEQSGRVWDIVERDQVLYTQREKGQPINKGVELDLIEGEKEGKEATFPVTISFCKLLLTLLGSAPIPQALGQNQRGSRGPGIYPFTDYVRDMVFLRWAKRDYKEEAERWEMATTALQIFEALLLKFDAATLVPNANLQFLFAKYPSFQLLTRLLAPHSSVIEVILDIYLKSFKEIDAEAQPLEDEAMEFVKSAMCHALKLIAKAIEKESSLLDLCQKYWPQRLSLRPLNTTLLSQQYREHIVSMARCIEYGEHGLVEATFALQILSHLNRTQQGITLRSVIADQIEVLQRAFSSQLVGPPMVSDGDTPDIRVSIIQFLLKSLEAAGHNLGLMLLDFSERSGRREEEPQDSVLGAILQIAVDPQFCLSSNALAESVFELLFKLLSHKRVGERFLEMAERVSPSFFIKLLQHNLSCTGSLPLSAAESTDAKEIWTCYLNQRAWLLRAISFEFHWADNFAAGDVIGIHDVQYLGFVSDGSSPFSEQAIWRIFELFDVDLGRHDDVDQRMDAEFIWGIQLEAFKMYSNAQRTGAFRWDIERAYVALSRAPEARNVVDRVDALGNIARSMLEHNNRVQVMGALERAYEAWAELIRCVLGNGIVEQSSLNNQLLLKLLDSILERLSASVHGAMWCRVSHTLSQLALAVMFYFRRSLAHDVSVKIAVAGCRTILEGMVHCILSQKAVRNPRANLYSTLSNYLHYCRFKAPNVLSEAEESRAINLGEKVLTERGKLNANNCSILLSRKDELLEIVFGDTVSKDAYLSSVASLVLSNLLSKYDSLLVDNQSISPPEVWLSLLLQKSRLLFVLKATCNLDEQIQRALSSQRHGHPLYQFEAMMNVVIAAAAFPLGTTELIDNNAVSQYLTQLKCLTSRVFWTAYSPQNGGGADAVSESHGSSLSMECSRYLMVLTPCLRLMASMFAACPRNVRLHYQTLSFLQKHNEIITKLLTLHNDDFVVLRTVRLLVSIWYQLYCGPLYVRDKNKISSISARDSSILEYIESKLPTFYFLLKKFKELAFAKEPMHHNDFDDDFGLNNGGHALYDEEALSGDLSGERAESVPLDIIRMLLSIFRLKSIGSSLSAAASSMCPSNRLEIQEAVFLKELSTENKVDEQPPNLRLLVDVLRGVVAVSRRTGKWIADQNEELRNMAMANNAEMLKKLHSVEPVLSTVANDLALQCFVIENILLVLYAHCEHYLKGYDDEFYGHFSSVVISEMVQSLKEWYDDEQSCILHVPRDMIEKGWQSAVEVPASSVQFIQIMISKFLILHRDNRRNNMITSE